MQGEEERKKIEAALDAGELHMNSKYKKTTVSERLKYLKENRQVKWALLKQVPLRQYIHEDQMRLFPEDEFPPCECGL